MKKFVTIVFLAVSIGAILGKVVFDQYHKDVKDVFNEDTKIYVLQQGVYSSEDSVKANTKNVSYYLTVKDNQYFRVYVGITKNKDYIKKIEDIFVSKGNDIYVRELTVNNKAFTDLLEQYDNLLKETNDEAEILEIEKQVLSKYEELVIRNE
jgi:hypothetical protein